MGDSSKWHQVVPYWPLHSIESICLLCQRANTKHFQVQGLGHCWTIWILTKIKETANNNHTSNRRATNAQMHSMTRPCKPYTHLHSACIDHNKSIITYELFVIQFSWKCQLSLRLLLCLFIHQILYCLYMQCTQRLLLFIEKLCIKRGSDTRLSLGDD